MIRLFQIIIIAIFGYIVVRIFRIISQMVKGPKNKSKFTNPSPSNTKIDLDDVIDADFEEIQTDDKEETTNGSGS